MPNQILEYLIKFAVMPLLSLFCGSSITDFMGTWSPKETAEDSLQGSCPGPGAEPGAVTAAWGQLSSPALCRALLFTPATIRSPRLLWVSGSTLKVPGLPWITFPVSGS